jgi:TetR/AcrR family transcriptional regulator
LTESHPRAYVNQMVKPPAQTQSPAVDTQTPDDDTEQRIFDAADRVFARRGTDGARMQEIAEEAGVNKALLHYYYRTKDRLAEAVFRHTLGKFLPAVIETMAAPDLELEEKVERVVHGYLDQLSQRPYMPGYLISEITHHPDRLPRLVTALAGNQMKRRVLTTLRRQIDDRVRQGEMVPITSEQFLVNILSLCIFPFAVRPMLGALLGIDGKVFERFIEERRRELPAFIMRALRP